VAISAQLAELPLASTQNLTMAVSPDRPLHRAALLDLNSSL